MSEKPSEITPEKEASPGKFFIAWGGYLALAYLLYFVLAFLFNAFGPQSLFILGLLISAWVIRSIVQWFNHRADPRFAKRPPDAP